MPLLNDEEFAAAEAQARAAVVRWQWFDGEALDPRPLHAQRAGKRPGKRVEQEPQLKIGAWRWGFDRDGRPRVGYEHLMTKTTRTMVYQHRGDGARVIEFVHNPQQRGVFAVSDVHGDLERPNEIERRERDALIREQYFYDGDRLMRVELARECPPGREVLRQTFRASYNPRGDVKFTEDVEFPEPTAPATLDVPLGKKEIEPFAQELQERLVTALMQVVGSAKVCGSIYCLILAYDGELPPMPALGSEEQRRRWRKEHGEEAKDYVWNPAEFEHYETPELQLEGDALLADCRRLSKAWRSSEAKVRKFVNALARRLADAPWPARLTRTDDFVIFATDLEGADRSRNMREVIPPGHLKRLRANGWLE